MSMPFSGVWGRALRYAEKVALEATKINLKPVNKIQFQFDPFHENASETRKTFTYFTARKRYLTNKGCTISSKIVCDRSDPTITFDLQSGEKLVFNAANLNSLEILELYHKHVTSTIPVEVVAPKKLPKTKFKFRAGTRKILRY